MQIPMDTTFDGSFFSTHSIWKEDPAVHVWRWGFSDLADDRMKSEVADLLAKILLGADPAALSLEELLVLSTCSLLIPEASTPGSPTETGSGIEFDA